MAARNRVAGNGRIGVADMRPRVHVINRSGDVELLGHRDRSLLTPRTRSCRTLLSCSLVTFAVNLFLSSRARIRALPLAGPSSAVRDARPQSAGSLRIQARSW